MGKPLFDTADPWAREFGTFSQAERSPCEAGGGEFGTFSPAERSPCEAGGGEFGTFSPAERSPCEVAAAVLCDWPARRYLVSSKAYLHGVSQSRPVCSADKPAVRKRPVCSRPGAGRAAERLTLRRPSLARARVAGTDAIIYAKD